MTHSINILRWLIFLINSPTTYELLHFCSNSLRHILLHLDTSLVKYSHCCFLYYSSCLVSFQCASL